MKIYTKNDLKNEEFLKSFYSEIEFEALNDVAKIIEDIKLRKDSALIEYCKRFNDGDFQNSDDFLVSENEIEEAYKKTDKKTIETIKIAQKNVFEFAKKQFDCIKELEIKMGDSILGHKIVPINSVLCYVPGGNYPLPSSCIMTVTPAKVAGVKNIYLTSPRIKPQTIVAAHISGADRIYKLGGAQAVSAFAYGTESINPVDKIAGPGNKYVTFAKKYVYGKCDIDFLAGPSEVLIVADDTSNLETKEIAEIAFEKSVCVVVEHISEAVEIANLRAPEHLELMFKGAEDKAFEFKNYGSLFIGQNCAEVFGDYCSGTNHVLPTNKASRYTGGLSVFDFIKILTYQNIDKKTAKTLAETASNLAEAEGLFAHKLASDLRK